MPVHLVEITCEKPNRYAGLLAVEVLPNSQAADDWGWLAPLVQRIPMHA